VKAGENLADGFVVKLLCHKVGMPPRITNRNKRVASRL